MGSVIRMDFRERFDRLDESIWTASYLPAWSSRAEAAATYRTGAGLELSIPPNQSLWCADLHPIPLRVSAVQSANRYGTVGSTDAPQPFLPNQRVREQQATVMGFVPHYGKIAVTCSARLTARSMFSAWMVGLEDRPERSGEICLMEVFGNTLGEGSAMIGQGIHPFRDPSLVDDFTVQAVELNVAEPQTYWVDWRPGYVEFGIDGRTTRISEQGPDYPMMLILGLFDFPGTSDIADGGGESPVVAGPTPTWTVIGVDAGDLGDGTVVRG